MSSATSLKCQGVVWRIWDKCVRGWARCEGVDSRDGDLEDRDRPSADFGLGFKEEGGVQEEGVDNRDGVRRFGRLQPDQVKKMEEFAGSVGGGWGAGGEWRNLLVSFVRV